ncbi:hypothetical protein PPRY_a1625 [Pseudoalteromonas prydzensis ACAM 620]|nr:hypothetical protein [Pseudoalteromonas prydzensis ACAM 620]
MKKEASIALLGITEKVRKVESLPRRQTFYLRFGYSIFRRNQ